MTFLTRHWKKMLALKRGMQILVMSALHVKEAMWTVWSASSLGMVTGSWTVNEEDSEFLLTTMGPSDKAKG